MATIKPRKLLVPLTGLEPVRILLRGILSPLCLPIPPQRPLISINIITYFIEIVKIFIGWDGWIRTSGMTESKSVALPLGYIPFSINIISYFIIFVKIFIGGSERIRTSEPLSGSLP